MENFDNWFVVGSFGAVLLLILVLLVQRLYQNPLLQKDYVEENKSDSKGMDVADEEVIGENSATQGEIEGDVYDEQR